jgi:hypothetical protein
LIDLKNGLSEAVALYWATRDRQTQQQRAGLKVDHGARSAATGGKQMDGFVSLMSELLLEAGVPQLSIHTKRRLQVLPGYFRPTKEWDLVVVHQDRLVLAVEAKSPAGPSFGNNFNNRTEEAMGSSLDLWRAFREGAFGNAPAPWLGYLLLLEDCLESRRAVKPKEPHFEVFPEFKAASYAQRYEHFCRRLVRERLYSATSLVLSERTGGLNGQYTGPASDLNPTGFFRSMIAHANAYGK